ncbi:protein boule-like [Dermochelys coriacea]|uniref:protein boule-like n=1 Tax=Dermochelys coriacea TaxID=27794 RepID=UPI001CA8A5AE|nr:protein boule-like [Dermochelys coriacea]
MAGVSRQGEDPPPQHTPFSGPARPDVTPAALRGRTVRSASGLGAAAACGGSCVRETCCGDFEAGVNTRDGARERVFSCIEHYLNFSKKLIENSEKEQPQQTTNQTQTESLSPSPNTVSPVPLNNPTSAPRFGTVIPNRIFVGGIDFKTNENDLRKFFAQYGCVKEVKIVNDRAGVSKGYGFITFETQEDAQKILQEAEKLNYKDKKLNIGPAIRKQQVGIPRSSIMPAAGTMYLTTSTGYPYTYHNGVAYFHTPEVAAVPQPWPSRSISSSPVMVAQPIYHQPTYPYQAPAQCLSGQWQWSVPQSPASSTSFFYLHPSEVIYQPLEIAQDSGCVPPPFSLMEAAVPEPYSDHGVQAAYHQVYAQSAIAMPTPVMQPEPVKEPRLHSVRRNFSHPSSVSLKPRYTRSPHFHPRKDYRMEDTILTPPSSTDSVK